MKMIREVLSIKKNHYEPEFTDFSAVITILNVVCVLAGFWWAPMLGLANCIFNVIYCASTRSHLNMYFIQIALFVLNCYFLTL